jgi:predicted AlkP superfamily pyrophosphatase or phosphodiesterase
MSKSLIRVCVPVLLILFLSNCIQAQNVPASRARKQTVLLITIDGFPAQMLNDPRLPMPTLRAMIAGGAVTESMEPSNPSITWPNHSTLVTGVDARIHHDVVNGLIVFPSDGTIPVSSSSATKDEMVHARTLYEAASEQGLTTAQIHWVAIKGAKGLNWEFSEQSRPEELVARDLIAQGVVTAEELLHFYDSNPAWRDQIRTAATVDVIEKYSPNFLMLHLAQTDAVEHEYGPATSAAYEAFASLDRCLQSILEAVKRKGIFEDTTFIVTSDHGFATSHHTINPNVALAELGMVHNDGKIVRADAWVKSTGGTALLYIHDPRLRAEAAPRIKERLEKIPGIARVLTNKEARAFGIPAEEDTDQAPTLYLVSAPDYSFGEQDTGELVKYHAPDGEHGFINTMPEMQTVFIAFGAAIRPAVRIAAISNLRVAPTIAKILGITFPQAEQPPLDEILTAAVAGQR